MTKFFAATAVAAAVLASCAQENVNNKEGNGTETYAGVDITLPAQATTRAEDANAGAPGEKKINTVGVYVIDEANGRFDGNVFSVNDFTLATVADRQVLTMKAAIKTVTGEKKLFVIANPSETATGTSNLRKKIETMRATVLNATGAGLPVSDFIVTAAGKVTQMSMTGGLTTAFTLPAQTDAQALEAANVKAVTIERNLAKVVLRRAATSNVVGGTTTLSWVLRGEAKDASMIAQAASLYATVPAAAEADVNHDYWKNFSSLKSANIPAGDFIPVNANAENGGGKTADYAASKYCFENFIPSASQFAGNTTTAIIKGQFVPTEVVKAYAGGVRTLGTSADLSPNKTFWVYKIDNTYWNESAKDAMIADGVNAGNFAEYVGGVGYYTVLVQDELGSVAVKRNNYYLIDIEEVRGPGRPVIDPDDPDDPTYPNKPTPKDTYISVSVTVKNWDFHNFVTPIS